MASLSPGMMFAGYRIEEEVGRGGMGVIYRATEWRPHRTVALKVVAPDLATNEAIRARFVHEAEVAPSIEHPHVVPVWRVGDEDGVLFIAMRFIWGSDLWALIGAEGRLEPLRAVRIVDQIADALDTAHKQGLVHRDVKPSNVLIEAGHSREHAYLTDFGLTRYLTSLGLETGTGKWVGTINYAAPEQLRGERVDACADVYSLGCLLFEALTGRVPFERDHAKAVMCAHLNAPPPLVSELVEGVSPVFDEIVARALAKKPGDRYLSAGDLGLAALAAAEDRPVSRAERSVASGEAAAAGSRAVAPPAAKRLNMRWRRGQSTKSRVRRIGVGIAGLLTVFGVIIALVIGASGGSSPSSNANGSRSVPVDTIRVGQSPVGVATGAGYVWVANFVDGTVIRLDARSGSRIGRAIPVVTTEGSLSESPQGISVGQGSVWVPNLEHRTVTRIDARSGDIRELIAVGNNPTAVAVGQGSVWVANSADNTVTRINATSGETVGQPIPVGTKPTGIAVGQGSVWVANSADNTVTRINATSGKVIGRPIPTGMGPGAVAVGQGSVWVADSAEDAVTRIGATSGNIKGHPISVGSTPAGIAVGEGTVWVVDSSDNTVTRINATSGETVGHPILVGENPAGIVVGAGSVWVTNSNNNTVSRIGAGSGAAIAGRT